MSTLEWRREQPRVTPPRYWNWPRIVCETLGWLGIAFAVGLFVGGGEWFFLLHAMFFGNLMAREFHQ